MHPGAPHSGGNGPRPVGGGPYGGAHQHILADFPDLEAEDIPAALAYAAEAVKERELPLTRSA
ncbi:MAG: DUF433 domain-containing protein [Acidimicrobiales bacterium]